MSNLKKYNLFIFINSFAKSLIEVFVVIILFNKGFIFNEIFMFLALKHLLCFIMLSLIKKISKWIDYSKFLILSSFVYLMAFYYLNIIKDSISYLIFLSFLLAIYSNLYWVGRHIYALSIIEEKKTTDNVFMYEMFGLFGRAFATYIGALTLTKLDYNYTLIVVFILLLLSVIPLLKIKDINIYPNNEIIKIVKTYPKRNSVFEILDQFRVLAIYLFPLYVYIYIKNDFKYIGLLTVISTIGSVIYLYVLSKKMDKNKKDYLKLSSILLAIVFFLKISIKESIIFLIIVFVEGFFKSALQAIVTRNSYAYAKNYNLVDFVYYNEYFVNIVKFIILLLFYLFSFSLKVIIIISVVSMIINSFIGFDDGEFGYSKS